VLQSGQLGAGLGFVSQFSRRSTSKRAMSWVLPKITPRLTVNL
jgi:hypothetical protein